MHNSNIYFPDAFRKFIIHKQAQESQEGLKFKPIRLPSGPREQEHHTKLPTEAWGGSGAAPFGSGGECLVAVEWIGCEKHCG